MEECYVDKKNTVLLGSILEQVQKIPDESIQVIVTSPPYYKLRNYAKNEAEQELEIGQEPNVETYISDIKDVFHKLKPKLKKNGLLWLNLGDTYINKAQQGIPWRVALALIQDGWILRSDVIWHKPNAMPSSVKNRPTTDHEYIFMFAKSKDYYYDADAIREPHVTFSDKSKMKGGRNHFGKNGGTPEQGKNSGNGNLHSGRWDQAFNPKGRNKRTVWSIPVSRFTGAHFAVFPEKLVETPILASSKPDDIVFDPFTGSGTTGVVSAKLGRVFWGTELVPEYQKMAQNRIDNIAIDISLF